MLHAYTATQRLSESASERCERQFCTSYVTVIIIHLFNRSHINNVETEKHFIIYAMFKRNGKRDREQASKTRKRKEMSPGNG